MMEDRHALEGRVERRQVLDGSRSARNAYVLVTHDPGGEERVQRLHVIGDESFDESALAPFLGRQVTISGGRMRNRVLRIALEMVSLSEPAVEPTSEEPS